MLRPILAHLNHVIVNEYSGDPFIEAYFEMQCKWDTNQRRTQKHFHLQIKRYFLNVKKFGSLISHKTR